MRQPLQGAPACFIGQQVCRQITGTCVCCLRPPPPLQSFLDTLEARCHGRTSLERLRSSPAYASFLRRWNTSVYFSLLYQEIAGSREHCFPQSPGQLWYVKCGGAALLLRFELEIPLGD
jgi:hypothetical protein